MTSRRIQRQRKALEQRHPVVNDTTALAQWMKAEAAAERAAHRRGQMYLAATVALFLTSGCLMVACGLLVVEVIR
jgi:hypothetical protein